MELDLLQIFAGFIAGLLVGVIAMLVLNKVKSGSASPASIKQDFDDYKSEVETHFEETSKKFKDMTNQYQDLYTHLSVGATSLCRPDSVAASLVDASDPAKPAQLESKPESAIEGENDNVSDVTPTPNLSAEVATDIELGESAQVDSERAEPNVEPTSAVVDVDTTEVDATVSADNDAKS